MSRRIKCVEVEYIESGTFQGGEEGTSSAGIKEGEDCVVISRKNFEEIRETLTAFNTDVTLAVFQ